jgi:Nuclease-related domain
VTALTPEPVPGPPPEAPVRPLTGSLMPEYERRVNVEDRRAGPRRGFRFGAIGDRRAAKRVQELCSADVLFLLNRKGGWRDGHIDMLAVGPAGIYVIDVKNYKGKKVEVRVSGGLFSIGKEQLFVGGRDRSSVVESIARQEQAVRNAVLDFPGGEHLPIASAMCFVDADLPLFTTQHIGGISCLRPKATARLLETPGTLDAQARTALHEHLAARLPHAG